MSKALQNCLYCFHIPTFRFNCRLLALTWPFEKRQFKWCWKPFVGTLGYPKGCILMILYVFDLSRHVQSTVNLSILCKYILLLSKRSKSDADFVLPAQFYQCLLVLADDIFNLWLRLHFVQTLSTLIISYNIRKCGQK